MARPAHPNKAVENQIAFLESLHWTVVFSNQAQEFHLACQVARPGDVCINVKWSDGADAVAQIKSSIAGPHHRRHPKSYPG